MNLQYLCRLVLLGAFFGSYCRALGGLRHEVSAGRTLVDVVVHGGRLAFVQVTLDQRDDGLLR
jgi:hypothetical protein